MIKLVWKLRKSLKLIFFAAEALQSSLAAGVQETTSSSQLCFYLSLRKDERQENILLVD